jgi:hypothetical protein
MDHIHLAIKLSIQKVSLAYRLSLPFRPRWQTNLNLYYDKDYTRYRVTRYGVVDTHSLATFSSTVLSLRKDIHHRAINLGPCTTSMYPQDID